MESVSFLAYVEAFRKPEYGKVAAWALVSLALVIALVWGFAHGHLYLVVGFAPLAFTLAAMKRAASAKVPKQTNASLSYADGVLRIGLPQTRLYDDGYVDQYYICSADDLESVAFAENGRVAFRARKLESFASVGEQTLERRTNEFCEVSFTVDSDGRASIERFLVSCELAQKIVQST